MVTDGGAPRCPGCNEQLQFGTDRQGRTVESCACGYRGFLETRGGGVKVLPAGGVGPPKGGGRGSKSAAPLRRRPPPGLGARAPPHSPVVAAPVARPPSIQKSLSGRRRV